ncbi:hypothetical protein RSAG8_05326, partial [Rhizoctonia solani AG-8 WAC10335]
MGFRWNGTQKASVALGRYGLDLQVRLKE